MSDAERLLACFEAGTRLRPSADTPNSVDLARALARLSGAAGAPGGGAAASIAEEIGESRHLVFVLVDGMGACILGRLSSDSFLRRHIVRDLQAVFPSTTSTALTSLATGEWASNHAVTGWWTYLEEIGGPATVLPWVTRFGGEPLGDRGVTLEDVFPLPSLVSSFNRSSTAVLPQQIQRSDCSRYFTGGTVRRGYTNVPHAVDRVLERVASAPGASYTYMYLPQVDAAAHSSGTEDPSVTSALMEVDRELERLSGGLGDDARLVVSADHGHLNSGGDVTTVRWDDELGATLRWPPSGDARVMHLHVRPDEHERFQSAFEQRFADRAVLLTAAEVESLELLGPGELAPLTRSRIGDFCAISTGAGVFAYAPEGTGEPDMAGVVSFHSGLTPDEMKVPLIVA